MAFFCKSPMVHRFCCLSVVSGQTKWDLGRFSIILFSQAYDCFEEKDSVCHRLTTSRNSMHFLNYCFWLHAVLSKFSR